MLNFKIQRVVPPFSSFWHPWVQTTFLLHSDMRPKRLYSNQRRQ